MFIILAILSLTFGAQIFLRSLSFKFKNYEFLQKHELKFFKYIFYFSIFAVFSSLIYYSYQQYIIWQSAEPSKFLLPPYQSINYFFYYISMRFFASYIVSLLISVLFLFSAKYYNKKYDERFFYPEEIYLGALALFLSGHPGWLFYFIGLILIYLFLHLLLVVSRKSSAKKTRISLYYWWILLAIFVMLLNNLLIKLDWWKLFKI